MRVTCTSISDFLETLEQEGVGKIHRRTIHLNVSRRPLDGTKISAAKFQVTLQATAVIDLGDDDGQYLLDFGELMGIDYEDASQDKSASKAAEKAEERIVNVCTNLGLVVRPGIISF